MNTKSYGQEAYEASLATSPAYHDGTPRPTWEKLSEIAKWSWGRIHRPLGMTYTVYVCHRGNSPQYSVQIDLGTDRGAAYASYIREVNAAEESEWERICEVRLEECESETSCRHVAVSTEHVTMEKWAVRYSDGDGNHYYEACDFRAEADADMLKHANNNPVLYSIP